MVAFKRLRQNLLDAGKLFEDEDFPAEASSIYFKRTPDDGWDNIEWKRPKEICDNPVFYYEGASRFDFHQGSLGNCWFISAAAALATKQKLLKKVVPKDQSFQENYAGIFKFNFWQYGRWIDVVVDDRLPTKDNQLVFCSNLEHPNEFWSALLEKAYAKLYGCYQALESGFSHDALVDMTGGIGEFINLKKVENKNKLFRTLRDTIKMNSLMGASIDVQEGQKLEDKLNNGLVIGHAYSVTRVAQFKVEDSPVRLIRLRNPWGSSEWTGAWGDGSEEWDTVPEDIKERLKIQEEDEGEFWMSFDDFMVQFNSLQLCHLTPDSVSGGKTAGTDWEVKCFNGSWVKGVTAGGIGAPPNEDAFWRNPQYFVKVTDPDDTDEDDTATLVVSLMQKFKRQIKVAKKTTEDLEECIGFNIFRYKKEAPEELDGMNADKKALRFERELDTFEYLREMSGRFMVAPGVYCIIPATWDVDIEGEFILRIATIKPVESGEVGETQQADVAQELEAAKPEKPKKQNRFDKMFTKFSGEDEVVDAAELRKIVNKGLKLDEEEQLTKETCRALISSVVTPPGSTGTATKKETREAWREVRRLKGVFEDYDVDDSQTLNRRELKQAFKANGYKLRKSTLGKIADQYCGKEEGLSFDEFVRLSVRTSNIYDRHQNQQTDMPFDDFLEAALLT